MEKFVAYLNAALPDVPGDDILCAFKRKTMKEMELRAGEVASRGLDNPTVIGDLIVSEYADVDERYAKYRKEQLALRSTKRFFVRGVLGSVLYILSLVAVYLFVSFATHAWDTTWAILTCGVLLWVTYLLSVGVKTFAAKRKIFHIFARMFLAGAVIVFTVAVYLFLVAVADLSHGWLIVIAGLIAMFVCDGAFAVIAKHRLAILSWLLYIPVIATFLFIIIGVLSILPWGVAWIIIPLSLALDFWIVITAIGRNKHERTEVADAWNEN